MFWTLPTILTWTRIVAIPLIVGVFYLSLPPHEANLIAALLFLAFAATDWLDGFLARRLKQTSAFGAFLDPVADKFLVCACLLVLVQLHRIDVFVALIIVGREIAISALREWMAKLGASRSVAVHMVGKLKTVVQMVAILCLLYAVTPQSRPEAFKPWWNDVVFVIGDWLLAGAALLTLWSAFMYLRAAWPFLRAGEGRGS